MAKLQLNPPTVRTVQYSREPQRIRTGKMVCERLQDHLETIKILIINSDSHKKEKHINSAAKILVKWQERKSLFTVMGLCF